jgi:photosystem II stability/assembly factor-like uncharacterized protein
MKFRTVILFATCAVMGDAGGWEVVASNTTKALNAVELGGRLVVGAEGTILYKAAFGIPGGGTPPYQAQASGTTRDLHGVSCINTCRAVGDSGTILHQVNGIWTMVNSGTTKNLRSVYFYHDLDSGYVVGDSGTILRMGGSSWTPLVSGTSQNLHHIRFQYNYLSGTNPNRYDTGFVVGAGGVILKSTNKGVSWTQLASGTTRDLYASWFADNSPTGFVVGDSGTILRTSNRGVTWVPVSSGTSSALYGIHFSSSANGIITGGNGVILGTSDLGYNWVDLNSGTTKDLHTGVAGNNQGGTVVGRDGIILTSNQSTFIRRQPGTGMSHHSPVQFFDPLGRRVDPVPDGIRSPLSPVIAPKE